MQASLFQYNSQYQGSSTPVLQSLQYEQLVRGINGAENHTPINPTTSKKTVVVGDAAVHYGVSVRSGRWMSDSFDWKGAAT